MSSPVLLSNSQSTELVKKLEIYGHQSLQVRSVIIAEFKLKSQGFCIWVDSWPKFTTLLLINSLGEKFHKMQYCCVFSLEEEKLKQMLKTPGLIRTNVIFTVLPVKFEHILQGFADERSQNMSDQNATFQLLVLNKTKSIPRKIPEDVTVSTLTPDLAKLVHTNYDFADPNNQEYEINFMQLLIASYPSVCLFNSEGKVIAYAMGQIYGGLGMLYVEPEFRNRGYGKTVTYLLSEKYSHVGYPPFVSVARENVISNKLHYDIGFEPTGCFVNTYMLKCK